MGLCLMITTDISRAAGPARPERTAVGRVYLSGIPSAVEGLASDRRGDPRVPGTDERSDQQNNTSFDARNTPLPVRRSGTPQIAYMRSIMALPNPEHETWVAPGMSRAK